MSSHLGLTARLRSVPRVIRSSAGSAEKIRYRTEVGAWLREGRLIESRTTVQGLRNAPCAFLGMLRGGNTGKMLVTI